LFQHGNLFYELPSQPGFEILQLLIRAIKPSIKTSNTSLNSYERSINRFQIGPNGIGENLGSNLSRHVEIQGASDVGDSEVTLLLFSNKLPRVEFRSFVLQDWYQTLRKGSSGSLKVSHGFQTSC
jgi:hypothetical protein